MLFRGKKEERKYACVLYGFICKLHLMITLKNVLLKDTEANKSFLRNHNSLKGIIFEDFLNFVLFSEI